MCEKAVEIQELWKPSRADCFCYTGLNSHKSRGAYLESNDFDDVLSIDGMIWLPRQDQLQGMLIKHNHPDKDVDEKFCAYYMYFNFFEWIPKHGVLREGKGSIDCNSMEQLWLAFVMSEKYSKRWDGEYWINLRD